MANERELKLKITGDASKAEEAAKKLEKALASAEKQLAELRAESAKTDGAVKDLGDKAADTARDVDKLGDEVEQTGGRFSAARAWLQGFRVDVDSTGEAAQKAGGRLDGLKGKASDLGGSLRDKLGGGGDYAGGKLDDLADKMRGHGAVSEKAADFTEKLGERVKGMGAASTVAATGVVAAGAAVAALAVAGVRAFNDLAGATTDLQRVLGGSAEDVSSFALASKNLGLGYEDLLDVSKEFSVNVADNRDELAKFGITVVETDRGAVDMQATLVGLVEKLARIEDPAIRAKVAATALGEEGAAKIGPLVARAGELREEFERIKRQGGGLDAEDLATYQQMQQSIRDLKGDLNEMAVVVGKLVVPEVAELASNVSYLTDALSEAGPVLDVLGFAAKAASGPVGILNDGISQARKVFGDLKETEEDLIDTTRRNREALVAKAKEQELSTRAVREAEEAEKANAEALKAGEEAQRLRTEAVHEAIEAERAKIDAQLEAVNVDYAYRGAIERTEDALAAVEVAAEEYTKALNENGDESAITKAAYEKLTDAQYNAEGAALAQAAAADRVAANNAKAAGAAYGAADAAAAQRDTLYSLAGAAGPGSTISNTLVGHAEVFGAIANNASVAASNVAEYNRQLLEAKGYEANFNAGGGVTFRASGGPLKKGQEAVITEDGAEAFIVHGTGPQRFIAPADGYVMNAPDTRRSLDEFNARSAGGRLLDFSRESSAATRADFRRRYNYELNRRQKQAGGLKRAIVQVTTIGATPRQVAQTIRAESALLERARR